MNDSSDKTILDHYGITNTVRLTYMVEYSINGRRCSLPIKDFDKMLDDMRSHYTKSVTDEHDRSTI